ncbi:hypothetical protein H6F67_19535 [Microcoleus sp. FACHB-1515]|uniref:hypothetical protein n=1 Tax=Cyanophyceae TaxID=3028117 RepID=UPI001684EC0E|nr:hypothetical protein [Microcoleus sp. FACHB-1515]MBD2092044.1 hypothetical protein [Microcoleus sp. FACHB-1515]
MFRSLRSLGLEFWLPLPLLGGLFWAGSSLIEHQLLNRSNTVTPIQVEPRQTPAAQVLSIKVEIDRDRNVSRVSASTITSTTKTQQFEISGTDQKQVETAIAQRFKLSPEQVKAIVRYQVKD